ncbi:heterokaryon incompatibility protein-domain-containing protein [Xylariomycetidae sp. FL0641]|nr:heterokaryon incompatibility protein-domain-containing protein [Xylariomycetidae sp. FL0641]
MRLLDTSDLVVREYPEPGSSGCPPYAILSHTWGGEEVSLQELWKPDESIKAKAGYAKLRSCAAKAQTDGYQHVWIDTCCIDKTSSAELSEAINSMYRWYKLAAVCYAYLEDVSTNTSLFIREPPSDANLCSIIIDESKLASCRWFQRGWTLQELIAPVAVEFYAADWSQFGTRSSLCRHVARITGIREAVLQGKDPSTLSAAERLSWAADRKTTRIEDQAYSLMGLFNVNMPLIYGEGERAFQRLQEEILGLFEDYTLFAWGISKALLNTVVQDDLMENSSRGHDRLLADLRGCSLLPSGLLAPHVSSFSTRHLVSGFQYQELHHDRSHLLLGGDPDSSGGPPILTGRGLKVTLAVTLSNAGEGDLCLAYINCQFRGTVLCVALRPQFPGSLVYDRLRSRSGNLYALKHDTSSSGFRTMYIRYRQPTLRLIPFAKRPSLKEFRISWAPRSLEGRCSVSECSLRDRKALLMLHIHGEGPTDRVTVTTGLGWCRLGDLDPTRWSHGKTRNVGMAMQVDAFPDLTEDPRDYGWEEDMVADHVSCIFHDKLISATWKWKPSNAYGGAIHGDLVIEEKDLA